MLPEFMIIGAQKSATSTLDWMLSRHPGVYLPNREVPFFEDPDYGSGDLRPLELIYEQAPVSLKIGLKRPNYLAKPECPSRIAKSIPDAKLIVILRHPVQRAVSAYFHYMQGGSLPCEGLNVGMTRLLDGKYVRDYPRSREILEFGLYSEQLERYFAYFPRHNFFIRNHSTVIRDVGGTLCSICEFLDVDPSPFAGTSRIPNKKKGVHSLRRIRMRQIATPFLHTRSDDGMRTHARQASFLRKSPGYAILAIDRMASWILPDKKPRLSSDVEQRLYSYYEKDIRRLASLLGPDFAFERHADETP